MKSTPANGDTYTVFLGGDQTAKTTAGTIVAKAEEPVETLDFTVNSGLTGTNATKPYGIENGKIIRVSGLTETDVVTVTVDGTAYTAKYYKTPDNEIIHIVALVTDKTITNDMISHTKGTPEKILFGDCNNDNKVNAVDITNFRRSNAKYTLNEVQMKLPTDIVTLAVWDVNGDGKVNAVDITAFRRANAKYTLNGVKLSLETMNAYTIK